jgi:hypothetical protein
MQAVRQNALTIKRIRSSVKVGGADNKIAFDTICTQL